MIKKNLALSLLFLALSSQVFAQELEFDRSRARDLKKWKPLITRYSERHYGESTWQLDPTCLVLHYTAMPNFPWNLVRSKAFVGETPGLACHYVINGTKIWEILPTNVRSRGGYGINHRGINIEMMALDSDDLATKKETLETCQKLCRYLMKKHAIEKSHIYSHEDVAKMDRKIVPEVLDLVRGRPYHKIDPGVENMKTILEGL